MAFRASDRSTGDEEASSENGARRCSNAREEGRFESQNIPVVGPFNAYFAADEFAKAHRCKLGSRDPGKVTDAQRQQTKREKDEKLGIKQFLVRAPTAEGITLKTIAASARGGAPLYSAVKSVAAKKSWQEIVNSVSAAPGRESSQAQISEGIFPGESSEPAAAEEELIALLAAVIADPLLQEVVRAVVAAPGLVGLLVEIAGRDSLKVLAKSVASDAELFSAVAAMAADSSLKEVVRSAMAVPGLADLLLGISRDEDRRKPTEELYANPALTDVLSELAKADGDLLRSLTGIIHAATHTSNNGHASSLVTEAVSHSLHDPVVVARTFAIRRAGGLRARILNWLLSIE